MKGTITIRHERRLPVTDAERAQGHTIGTRQVSLQDVVIQLDVDVEKLLRVLGEKAARNSSGKSSIAVGVKAKVLSRGIERVLP